MTDDVAAFRGELDALTERVATLEAASARADFLVGPVVRGDEFWAVNALQSQREEHPSTVEGSVMLVGSLTLPTGTPVSWQQGVGTAGLLETEWDDRAAAFAALGNPVRLELLRQILSGVHATAELAAIETLGTTGQLHHHLRQLVAAGWVRQGGRGTYEVPAARVVPLLACLLGVER